MDSGAKNQICLVSCHFRIGIPHSTCMVSLMICPRVDILCWNFRKFNSTVPLKRCNTHKKFFCKTFWAKHPNNVAKKYAFYCNNTILAKEFFSGATAEFPQVVGPERNKRGTCWTVLQVQSSLVTRPSEVRREWGKASVKEILPHQKMRWNKGNSIIMNSLLYFILEFLSQ